MLESFFNSYNFTEIYTTISRFYKDGEMELKKVISETISNPDIVKSTWGNFDFDLGKILNFIPVGTTIFQPSFSSYVEIYNRDYGDLIRIKRVHYFVSILGP